MSASIPSMGKLLEVNGRMDNFRRLTGKSTAAQRGPVYSDSDIYKWIEAAGFALQSGERPELRSTVDKDIREIVAAQQADGYLNTYYVREHAAQRMEPKTQQHGHELYCIGHLLQGGIAYYRATGDRTLLDAGIRFVNEFLLPNFGPGSDKKPLFSVTLQFNMTPQILEANAQVTENNGRVAVQRGPLVYCMEQIDQGEGVALKDVAVSADKGSTGRFEEKFDKDLLGGVLVLRHAGLVYEESAGRSGLYFSHDAAQPKSRPAQLTFIPYYAWANRVQTPMQVWTPVARA
jgi:DUF1680 family protein